MKFYFSNIFFHYFEIFIIIDDETYILTRFNCVNCDLSLSTKSEGTRYRVLYLFKGKNLYDNRRKPQLISSQFQGATNLGLPNSQTVAEVCIAQPAQSSNEAGSQEKVECPVCKKLFAAGQRLRTHMSRMHKNEFKDLKDTHNIFISILQNFTII